MLYNSYHGVRIVLPTTGLCITTVTIMVVNVNKATTGVKTIEIKWFFFYINVPLIS